MKNTGTFIKKIKRKLDKQFFVYTGIFLGLMLAVFLYIMLADMSIVPRFTYAEF